IEVSAEWEALFSNGRPPKTFPEYLRLIDPSDRRRIAVETAHAFLLTTPLRPWHSTFYRSGRLILALATPVSPGRVLGLDIDLTTEGPPESADGRPGKPGL
ncbi:MAG: hypothetical protein JW818_14455, partial [Pirellulales bacterium]|nr:hypothetical protein [Pirellulales bacterium]